LESILGLLKRLQIRAQFACFFVYNPELRIAMQVFLVVHLFAFQTVVVNACRSAIKDNNVNQLIKVIQTGQP
jgi:hypothetical protein